MEAVEARIAQFPSPSAEHEAGKTAPPAPERWAFEFLPHGPVLFFHVIKRPYPQDQTKDD